MFAIPLYELLMLIKGGPVAGRAGLSLVPSETNPAVRRWQHLGSHFASGTNRAGEVRALVATGQPIGLAAPEVTPAVEAALYAHVPHMTHDLFVDSGAFSEVEIPDAGPPRVVRPMTDEDWQRVLGLYGRLSSRFGEAVHVVAPDRVGDQDETLHRLRHYREQLIEIAGNDGEILIPLQRGARSLPVFYAAALKAIDPPPGLLWRFTPAIPYKKAATSDADVLAFVRDAKPRRLHLLGGGAKGEALRDQLRAEAPGTSVSSDSNLTRAMVGRTNGPGGGPRRLTAAMDAVRSEQPNASPDHVRAAALHRVLAEERGAVLAELEKVDTHDARHAAAKLRATLRGPVRRAAPLPPPAPAPAPPPTFTPAALVPGPVLPQVAPRRPVAVEQLPLFKGIRLLLKAAQLTLFAPQAPVRTEARHVRGHVRRDGVFVRDHVRATRVTGPKLVVRVPPRPVEHPALELPRAPVVVPPPVPTPEPVMPTPVTPAAAPTLAERITQAGRTLYEQFGPAGAPKKGERGYKPPGHDGRHPDEIAATAVSSAASLLGDPDFYAAWSTPVPDDPEYEEGGLASWDSYDEGIGEGTSWEDAEGAWTSADLPELLDLPRHDGAGAPYSRHDRIDLARRIVRVAMETDPEYASGSHLSDQARMDGFEVPRAIVDEVVAQGFRASTDPTRRRIVLVDLDTAEAFVQAHHSAFPTMNRRGLMYAIGLQEGDRLVAVATAGSPTGRWADPHGVLELTRIASDGSTRGASSALCARLLDLLPKSGRKGAPGRLFVTYSLDTEEGSTYKALKDKGLRPVALGSYHGEAVRRIRWEAGPDAGPADWSLLDRQGDG